LQDICLRVRGSEERIKLEGGLAWLSLDWFAKRGACRVLPVCEKKHDEAA
jgi:hypothetical protein